MSPQAKYYKYRGVVHIHTLLSDGSGDIYTITKAAKKAGLKWIVITDHNNMDIEEGIINGILVIKGEEISPKSVNHYIALGLKEKIISDNPEEYISKVKEQGGFGFIAHPDEGIERNNRNTPIKWIANDSNVDGVEIWNWFSMWADKYDDRNIFTIIWSYFFAHKYIKTPYKQTLARWDRLNNESRKIIPAIAGVDAHALKISKYIIPVTVFPYKKMFKTIANIIYTTESLRGDFEKQKNIILTALKNGNNVILNRFVSDKIPSIEIKNRTNQAIPGESISLDDNTYLNIKLPEKCIIKILLNGTEICILKAQECSIKLLNTGKYRTEILKNSTGWLYTNPIEVYETKTYD